MGIIILSPISCSLAFYKYKFLCKSAEFDLKVFRSGRSLGILLLFFHGSEFCKFKSWVSDLRTSS